MAHLDLTARGDRPLLDALLVALDIHHSRTHTTHENTIWFVSK